MVGISSSIVLRRVLIGSAVATTLGLAPSALAEQRSQGCGIDEDCPVGAYCSGAGCVALEAAGAECDRDSICGSGLCYALTCGDLTIDSPLDGVLTNRPKLVVTGRAPAFAPVHVQVEGKKDIVVADELGRWVWRPAFVLEDGEHHVKAFIGRAERIITMHVDTVGPAVAIVSPQPTYLGANGQVIVRGELELGSSLLLRVDGVESTALLGDHGAWSHAHWLGNGWHTIEATGIDPAGNESVARVEFAIDLEAPSIAISGPNDGAVYGHVPELLTGRAEPQTRLDIVGHGVDQVVSVGDSGAWSVPLPRLADGTYTFLVTATDRAGWTSTDSVTITIDTVAPGLAFATNLDQTTLVSTRPELRGTADPGSDVVVELDGHRIGADIAGGDSRWSVTPSGDLAEGIHDFAVTATDRGGNVTRTESWFIVDRSAPQLSIVRPSELVLGEPVVLAGRAEQRASIEARLDGRLVATAIADRHGDWSLALDVELGTHTVVILARDIVGHSTEGTIELSLEEPAPDGGCTGGGASGLAAALAAAFALLAGLRRGARHTA